MSYNGAAIFSNTLYLSLYIENRLAMIDKMGPVKVL